jgi:SAM-dependent methyltransferase
MKMFEDLTGVYEAMIDWPKRLAHEGPFFRRLFEQNAVQSVVDVACGTGHHAAMFHDWGLRVEGADLAEAMIERARANFGQSPTMRWVARGFDQPITPAGSFDAAVCLGNSLPLAADTAMIERTLSQMLAAVRSGGLVVVHALNLGRLPDGPCVWQKCRRIAFPQGEALVVKGVHRCGPRGYVELVVADLGGTNPPRTESVALLGLSAEQWESMAKAAGAAEIRLLGGYRDEPYHPTKSVDLLLVATKART